MDERANRLPQWAQAIIISLEGQVEREKRATRRAEERAGHAEDEFSLLLILVRKLAQGRATREDAQAAEQAYLMGELTKWGEERGLL